MKVYVCFENITAADPPFEQFIKIFDSEDKAKQWVKEEPEYELGGRINYAMGHRRELVRFYEEVELE